MQDDVTETNEQTKEVVDFKQYLISNENFQLLKECQQEIFNATEVSPSIRKIINELINQENLQVVKKKFISVWNR